MGRKPGPLFLAFRWHGKIIAGWLSRIHHFPFWQFENIVKKRGEIGTYLAMKAFQGGKMSKYTKQQKLDWLKEALDHFCFLQVTHPHLAWYPNEEDKAIYQEIIKHIENSNLE